MTLLTVITVIIILGIAAYFGYKAGKNYPKENLK